MKVMIFNTLYFPYRIGGAEVSVQILAEELANQGHSVRVVSLTEDKEKSLTLINGVESLKLPLANVYWPFSDNKKSKLQKAMWHLFDYLNIKMYFKVMREIKDFSPDIVHTNNISGFSVLLWKAVKKCNIRLIHTSRDYYLFHPNSTLFSNGKNMAITDKRIFFWSAIKEKYSRYVDEYVGISHFIQKLHESNGFFKNANTHVIYNAVNEIKSNKQNEIRRIGFIGRLTIEKGFDIFCDVAEKNKGKYSFIAAGNYVRNHEQSALNELAKKSGVVVKGYMNLDEFLDQVDAVVLPIKWNQGRVIFKGRVENKELARLYQNSLFLLFPSLYEGFGLPVIEAMSSGTAVITSNTTSLPEVAGDAALLVDPESIEEISGAINNLYFNKNIRDELIEKGLKQAKKYSWATTADKIKYFLNGLSVR